MRANKAYIVLFYFTISGSVIYFTAVFSPIKEGICVAFHTFNYTKNPILNPE